MRKFDVHLKMFQLNMKRIILLRFLVLFRRGEDIYAFVGFPAPENLHWQTKIDIGFLCYIRRIQIKIGGHTIH